jgi:hypothetical protein
MATDRGPDQNTPTAGRRSRVPIWIALAVGLVALVAVVLVVFQPQKLFLDDKVDEAVPVATSPSTDGAAGAPAASNVEPQTLRAGQFISRDHSTSGAVAVLDVGGTTYLRLEDLTTDNGPDLYVYLTTNPAEGEEGGFDEDFVDLGRLKGNIGSQNYEIPAGTDLARYGTVVIWCDRFDAAFGAADLS